MRASSGWAARLAATLGAVLLGVLLASACDGRGASPGAPAADSAPALGDSVFTALVRDLSEPGGYFDTDNLISNEASYLQVMGDLAERGVRGGVYVGVGPSQNFSYMAAIRPELAFIVDVRRDNLLQHLWFKALFEASTTRLDYLCLMVARSCGGTSQALDLEELVRAVDAAAPVDTLDALMDGVVARVEAMGVPLSPADRSTLRAIHRRFAREGLDLRFNTHGRAPLPSYPTLRRLLLERDRSGRQANYLADEDDYRFLARLQAANRVIPVVGDLAGDHAVEAIGREAARRDLVVSAFYVSNVEFYLFGDDVFPRWVANLATLPVTPRSVIIRSYFNRFRPIPRTIPGYVSTQLVDPIRDLLAAWQAGRIGSYQALITRSSAGAAADAASR